MHIFIKSGRKLYQACLASTEGATTAQEKFVASRSDAKSVLLPFTDERGEELSSALMRQNRNIANPDVLTAGHLYKYLMM